MAEFLTIIYQDNSKDELAWAQFDGQKWTGNERIKIYPNDHEPRSIWGVDAAVLNNWIYIIYPGENFDQLYTSWFDGSTWRGNVTIKDQSDGKIGPLSNRCPAIANLHGTLVDVHKGNSSGSSWLYTCWFNGSIWYGDKAIVDQAGKVRAESGHGPSAIEFRHKLYAIYLHKESKDLRYITYDGVHWEDKNEIKIGNKVAKTNSPPGLTVYKDRLYAFYKGESSDNLYFSYFDGSTWVGNEKIEDQPGGIKAQSDYSPRAAVFKNKIYLVYKGKGSNDLYTAWYDGSYWRGNEKISKQAGNIKPKSKLAPAVCVSQAWPVSYSWMSRIDDDMFIGDINIPGTHESAALNSGVLHLGWACQNYAIIDQLQGGIRLLDVRLKVVLANNKFEFWTCHGNLGFGFNNTFQSFASLLDECRDFLAGRTTEAIILTWKIEQRPALSAPDIEKMYNALLALLKSYPITMSKDLQRMGDVRGKIVVYNRQFEDGRLGCPIIWTHSESVVLETNAFRNYEVYVQDQWHHFSLDDAQEEKFRLVEQAIDTVGDYPVVLNFASAVRSSPVPKIEDSPFGIYVMPNFVNLVGQSKPRRLGWILWDFAFNYVDTESTDPKIPVTTGMNVVELMIASNFGYRDYNWPWRVIA